MTHDDLPSKVRDWLQQEGYPFEMRVAQAFAKAGFRIQQSDYYDDPQTGVPREVDVVARIQSSVKSDLIFRVLFLVECKSSLDRPWLLFCSTKQGDLANPGRVAQRISSNAGAHVLFGLSHDKDVQNLALFRLRAPIGYGLKQSFAKDKKEKDIAYAAMCSVGNAAKAGAMQWIKHPHEPRIVELIFPVIAIDGRLFRCWLDEANVLSVGEVASGTLLWRNAFGHLGHTIIDIQTTSSLEEFAAESYESAFTLVTNYYETARGILAERSKRLPL